MLAGLLLAASLQGADLGTPENPILCDDVRGERWYLSRLRTPEGDRLTWSRRGSFGGNKKDKHLLDGYRAAPAAELYLDMYHPGVVEIRAPKGYRLLTEWSERFEYIDGRIHAFKDADAYTGEIREKNEEFALQIQVKEGQIQSSVTKTYPDGKVLQRVEYGKANQRHGAESWFRADGKPWAVHRYENGRLHGKFERYDANGDLEASGEYVDGQLKEPKE